MKKEKNAVNVIGAIARKNMRMEVFSRIRLVARERFLEQNAERIITNLFKTVKSNVLTHLFSKWRVRTYTDVVKEMNERKQLLAQTIRQNAHECEVMETHKQAKAVRILRSRKQREVANAWINMAKILKAIRVKKELCQQNIAYLQTRWATQRWLKRVKLTQYLRKKNAVAI